MLYLVEIWVSLGLVNLYLISQFQKSFKKITDPDYNPEHLKGVILPKLGRDPFPQTNTFIKSKSEPPLWMEQPIMNYWVGRFKYQ